MAARAAVRLPVRRLNEPLPITPAIPAWPRPTGYRVHKTFLCEMVFVEAHLKLQIKKFKMIHERYQKRIISVTGRTDYSTE